LLRRLEEIPFLAAHRRKGPAMDRAGTQRREGGEVLGRPVPFMFGEAISGILAIQLDHEPVTGDLGDDTGGGD
jgi:hypothetical protein